MGGDKRPLLCDDTECLQMGITSFSDVKRFLPRDWMDVRDIPGKERKHNFTQILKEIAQDALKHERSITVPFFNALVVYGRNAYYRRLGMAHEIRHLLDLLRNPSVHANVCFMLNLLEQEHNSFEKAAATRLVLTHNLFCSYVFELSATWLTEYEICTETLSRARTVLATQRKRELERIMFLPENQDNWPYVASFKIYNVIKERAKLNPVEILSEIYEYEYVTQGEHAYMPAPLYICLQEVFKDLEGISDGEVEIKQLLDEKLKRKQVDSPSIGGTPVISRIRRVCGGKTPNCVTDALRDFITFWGITPSLAWAAANSSKTFALVDVDQDGRIESLQLGIPKGVPEETIKLLIDIKLLNLEVLRKASGCVFFRPGLGNTYRAYDEELHIPGFSFDDTKMTSLLESRSVEAIMSKVIEESRKMWKKKRCKKMITAWTKEYLGLK